MVKITFPDGSVEEWKKGVTPLEIAKSIGTRLLKDALAAKVNDRLVDLNYEIQEDCKLKILTFDDEDGKRIYWHSSSHILAIAVKKLFPNVKLAIGPAIDQGFYYDFEGKFKDEDLVRIEEEIRKVIKEDMPFERKEVTKAKAKELFSKEKFKTELINGIEGNKVSIYKTGDFIDLCEGPHVPSTGKIGAVKLLKLAGAYWKGDSKNPMLSRIYGISFRTDKELDSFLDLRKRAEENDHRSLGQKLDLYSFHEEAPGMAFFHPKGMVIWNELVNLWKEEHRKRDYKEVKTPLIMNLKLWHQSGHFDHYKDNMYFIKMDDQDFAVKPMNCPGAILVYKNTTRSYKELPLRLAELGFVHRHELSGVLSGLFRVRSFVQDDAHIFVMPQQIEDEIYKVIDLIDYIYKIFGLEYEVKLSTRPQSFMGNKETWDHAESALKRALEKKGIKYAIDEGEGTFYGPKIDFHIKDSLGRTWQCATSQLDFQMPERFDLKYTGEDNKEHRPVIIHRVIYGAIERFIGILVEHYGGNFPLWLSPVQAIILPVADRHVKYAEQIKEELSKNSIRVETDYSSNTVEYRIRDAQMQKIPYIIVLGDKEENKDALAVRTREGKVQFDVKLSTFIKQVLEEIKSKK